MRDTTEWTDVRISDAGMCERMLQLRAQSRVNELGPMSGSAREAMMSAVRCFVEHPTVMVSGIYHCQGIQDAACRGYAYAMFQTAQLYQCTEPDLAEKCYAMAARFA